MDVFSYISLFGGLALFLYGMNVMSGGLEKTAGGKMEKILEKITSNKFRGLALGVSVTAIIQSSSAVTVMLVGLVNSGIMSLTQAVSVTFGSNIGTTITSWILSLTGIESSSFFIKILNPKYFSPVIALIGVILFLSGKSERKKLIGTIFLGFAILMYGMNFMTSSVAPLAEMPEFRNILTVFSNPILGVLVGLVFTAVVQSSSASVGVLQALALTGSLSYQTAIPIILGQNIGTCISAVVCAIGTNKNAKRVATVHVLFNSIGSVICLAIWLGANAVFNFTFASTQIDPFGIAVVHTVFNVFTTVILLPFSSLLEKLACKIIRDDTHEEKYDRLDTRLLSVPSVAVAQAYDMAKKMNFKASDALKNCISGKRNWNIKMEKMVLKSKKELDVYEDKLASFLVKLSQSEITDKESNTLSLLLRVVGEYERIGDHTLLLSKSLKEISSKKILFSNTANNEINKLCSAILSLISLSDDAFSNESTQSAKKVKPLEIAISEMIAVIKSNHILRLKNGECTLEYGFVLSDLLVSLERVSGHYANIALAVLETAKGRFSVHEYTSRAKKSSVEFNMYYREYKRLYNIERKKS